MVNDSETDLAPKEKPPKAKKAAPTLVPPDPFSEWFRRALDYEGRVTEDVPGDKGGPTKWGITLGRLATIKGVKTPKRGTVAFRVLKDELFALSEDEIKQIYRRDYWEAVRADDLPVGLSYAVADFGLNSGPSRAVKALQKLLGNPQTGKMDDETIREAHAFDRIELLMLYIDERERFLHAIVAGNASQRKFLRGWLNRTGDVRRVAIAMAEKAPAPVEVAQKPAPKAEPPEPPEPTVVVEASKSWTTRILGGVVVAKISEWWFNVSEVMSDGLDSLTDVASRTASESSSAIAPLASLSSTLKLNLGAITFWVTIACLGVAIARHVRDKVEKTKLKHMVETGQQQAPGSTP